MCTWANGEIPAPDTIGFLQISMAYKLSIEKMIKRKTLMAASAKMLGDSSGPNSNRYVVEKNYNKEVVELQNRLLSLSEPKWKIRFKTGSRKVIVS